jgi:hypothetical protein
MKVESVIDTPNCPFIFQGSERRKKDSREEKRKEITRLLICADGVAHNPRLSQR